MLKKLNLLRVLLLVLATSCNTKQSLEVNFQQIRIENYKTKKYNDIFSHAYFDLIINNRTRDTLFYIDSFLDENEIFFIINDDTIYDRLSIVPSYEVFLPRSKSTISLYTKTTDDFLDSIGLDHLLKGNIRFQNYNLYEGQLSYNDSAYATINNLIVSRIQSLEVSRQHDLKINIE